jgi:hypothetical protein
LVEQLEQLGEIGMRPGEPVNLGDHDDIESADPDLGSGPA